MLLFSQQRGIQHRTPRVKGKVRGSYAEACNGAPRTYCDSRITPLKQYVIRSVENLY